MIATTRKVDVSKYGSSIPSMIKHTPNVGAESVNKTSARISAFMQYHFPLSKKVSTELSRILRPARVESGPEGCDVCKSDQILQIPKNAEK